MKSIGLASARTQIGERGSIRYFAAYFVGFMLNHRLSASRGFA
jgi:hypothetical protein